jgi:hypothetical protein
MTTQHIANEDLKPYCDAYLRFVQAGEPYKVSIHSQNKSMHGHHVIKGVRRSTATYTVSQYEERNWCDAGKNADDNNRVNNYLIVENRNGMIFYAVQLNRKGPFHVYQYPQRRVLRKILNQIHVALSK